VPEIAILGAGELGGTLAEILARRDVATVIRLVDDAGRSAEGKALDIAQSGAVQQFSTRLFGSTDLTTAAAAELMIIADRAAGGEWHGDDALALLKRIIRLAPHRLIVCAGAAQRELVERGVRELRLERSKIFGSAPEALAAAVRAIVAAETDVSPRDVALTVLGVPPSQIVVPWENGFAATAGLAEPARRALAGRIARLWPPGPLALASAAAKTVEAAFGRTRQTVSVFVAPDDSQGRRARTAALLARIGPAGIELLELALNARDRVALESAMLI
jgi:malate/lactate dehydrogenase